MAPSQDTVSLSFSRVVSDVSPWIIENSTKLETLPQEVGCFIRPIEPYSIVLPSTGMDQHPRKPRSSKRGCS